MRRMTGDFGMSDLSVATCVRVRSSEQFCAGDENSIVAAKQSTYFFKEMHALQLF